MTAFPDVKCVPITADTEFILLACDGIWDCMTSQVAVSFMHLNGYGNNFAVEKQKKTLQDLSKAIESICDECCAKDLSTSQGLGCDNMTAIIVEIKQN